MVSNAECRNAYQEILDNYGATITDHMICAAEDGGGKGKYIDILYRYFVSCLFAFFQI